MHVQLGHIWVDVVSLTVLGGVLLACALYVLWCNWIKSLRGGDGTVQAGVYRLAAARGDLQTMACLHAAAGLDVDAAHGGFSALHAAAVAGQQDAAIWLVTHGASTNLQKQDGWQDTVLHYAASKGHIDMVDTLLAFGSDPAAKNCAGATPADLAARSGHKQLAIYLHAVQAGTATPPDLEVYLERAQQLDKALQAYLNNLAAAVDALPAQRNSWSRPWCWMLRNPSTQRGQLQAASVEDAQGAVQKLLPSLLKPACSVQDCKLAVKAQPPSLPTAQGHMPAAAHMNTAQPAANLQGPTGAEVAAHAALLLAGQPTEHPFSEDNDASTWAIPCQHVASSQRPIAEAVEEELPNEGEFSAPFCTPAPAAAVAAARSAADIAPVAIWAGSRPATPVSATEGPMGNIANRLSCHSSERMASMTDILVAASTPRDTVTINLGQPAGADSFMMTTSPAATDGSSTQHSAWHAHAAPHLPNRLGYGTAASGTAVVRQGKVEFSPWRPASFQFTDSLAPGDPSFGLRTAWPAHTSAQLLQPTSSLGATGAACTITERQGTVDFSPWLPMPPELTRASSPAAVDDSASVLQDAAMAGQRSLAISVAGAEDLCMTQFQRQGTVDFPWQPATLQPIARADSPAAADDSASIWHIMQASAQPGKLTGSPKSSCSHVAAVMQEGEQQRQQLAALQTIVTDSRLRGWDGEGSQGTQLVPTVPVSRPLICITQVLSAAYLIWRAARSCPSGWMYFYSVPVLLAEMASILMSYIFMLTMWSQVDRPARWLADMFPQELFPSVDVYVVCYNEPVDVVEPTCIAALNLNYPGSKLVVHVLDDGKSDAILDMVKRLQCQTRYMHREAKIKYVARDKVPGVPHHAKAGNINNALLKGYSGGDYILVLDCDMILHPDFLMRTLGHFYWQPGSQTDDAQACHRGPQSGAGMGPNASAAVPGQWVLKDKAAFVQTPQDFWNVAADDPLVHFGRFFYGPMLQGWDGAGAATCCGTGVVFRRDVLVSAGGQAYGSITEDYNTAMDLLACGFSTMFLHERMVFGQAPADLVGLFKQRRRWALGALQILVRDNPLTRPGLTFVQSLLYWESAAHHFLAIPTILLAILPVVYMFTGVAPVTSDNLWEFCIFFCGYYMANRVLLWYLHRACEGGDQEMWRGSQMFIWIAPSHLMSVVDVLLSEVSWLRWLTRRKEIAFEVTQKASTKPAAFAQASAQQLQAAAWRLNLPYLIYYAAVAAGMVWVVVHAAMGTYTIWKGVLAVDAFGWAALVCLCIWPPVSTLLPREETEQGWRVKWDNFLPVPKPIRRAASDALSLFSHVSNQSPVIPGQQHGKTTAATGSRPTSLAAMLAVLSGRSHSARVAAAAAAVASCDQQQHANSPQGSSGFAQMPAVSRLGSLPAALSSGLRPPWFHSRVHPVVPHAQPAHSSTGSIASHQLTGQGGAVASISDATALGQHASGVATVPGVSVPVLHSHPGMVGLPGRSQLIRGASTLLTGLVLPERPDYHPFAISRTSTQDAFGVFASEAAGNRGSAAHLPQQAAAERLPVAISGGIYRAQSTGPVLLIGENGEVGPCPSSLALAHAMPAGSVRQNSVTNRVGLDASSMASVTPTALGLDGGKGVSMPEKHGSSGISTWVHPFAVKGHDNEGNSTGRPRQGARLADRLSTAFDSSGDECQLLPGHLQQWAVQQRLPGFAPQRLQSTLPAVWESDSAQLSTVQIPGTVVSAVAAPAQASASSAAGCVGSDLLPGIGMPPTLLRRMESIAASIFPQQHLLPHLLQLPHQQGLQPVEDPSTGGATAAACPVRKARQSVGTLAQFLAGQLAVDGTGSTCCTSVLGSHPMDISQGVTSSGGHQQTGFASCQQAAITSMGSVVSSMSAAVLVPTEPASIFEASIASRPNFEARQQPPASYWYRVVTVLIMCVLLAGTVVELTTGKHL